MAKFMLTLLAEFVRMERETLIERTISGQRRAWEVEGKQKGRPKGTTEDSNRLLNKYPEVVRHLKAGKSLRDVAARCSVAINTVRKVKNAVRQSQTFSDTININQVKYNLTGEMDLANLTKIWVFRGRFLPHE